MSNPIDYQSRHVPQPPSEYEHAYEQERGRWLRRRLMWYAGTSLAFGLLMSLPMLALTSERTAASDLITLLVSNAGAALVLALAWRCKPRPQLVLRIAFLFYVLSSLWTIGYTHISFANQVSEIQSGFRSGYELGREKARSGDQNPTTLASTVPASKPALIEGDLNRLAEPVRINIGNGIFNANAAQVREYMISAALYLGLLFGFLFNHLIVCLFIPWTVRESIRPAGIIAGAAIGTAAIHVVLGLASWMLLIMMMCLVPFMFVPGTLVCWWRYSRFNKRFQLQFESSRYRVLQHELSSARAVHDANLPEPRLNGPVRLNYLYEPMREIGGDLLMIYPTDKNSVPRYIILFDVTGHGVTAALSVNRIVGEIERLLAENPDESAINLARSLNRYIHLTLARHHLYVSAILIKVNLEQDNLECVNAGHPTAYHVDCQAKTTTPIESTAMLLGVVDADSFFVESLTIPFTDGHAIVGYTDGASEATDPDGRMLGLAGVHETICSSVGLSANPGDWPQIISRRVIEHRLAPSQDDTIIFSLWRA